jgi:aminoglycoside phosphotransferase (APT) family kinase protein
MPEAEIGPRLAAGRDTVVFALGDDRVLRRAPDERSYDAEAAVMEHVRAHGYPVPAVHRIGPGEMVLERVPGPTMAEDLTRRPWRLAAHARLLADLHHHLHRLPPPDGLPLGPVEGDAVIHLDLHPLNVIMSPTGPMVIDWTNAASGAPAVDVALTWIIVAVSEVEGSAPERALINLFRSRFVDRFLDRAGRDAARAVLPEAADYRNQDRNARPSEIEALARLVAAETGR